MKRILFSVLFAASLSAEAEYLPCCKISRNRFLLDQSIGADL